MDPYMLLYWEAVEEIYSNESIIHKSYNPLRDFEEELIDGPIIDIGCGQSNFLLEYSKTGRKLYAIDNEDYQLQKLSTRINDYAGNNIDNVNFINQTLLKDELPNQNFSLVILSNILHFFNLDECKEIVNQIKKRIKPNSLIYILVHSDKHPANNPNSPNNNDYFKHYFRHEDLKSLFKNDEFEEIFFADIQRTESKFDQSVTKRWAEKTLDKDGIHDAKKRKARIDYYLSDIRHADLAVIYKKI